MTMLHDVTVPVTEAPTLCVRQAKPRSYLMCRPDYFTVAYSLNPFMDPTRPTDTALALRQWEGLRDAYRSLGHRVSVLEPRPGLVDMVFAANGGFTLDGIAYVASFAFPERRPEAAWFQDWFRRNGFRTLEPMNVNEGEGDFAFVGGRILAGYGFRSSRESHAELARSFGRDVVSLKLVDSRFYHLDVALTVLDSEARGSRGRIAYLPSAFDARSRGLLEEMFPSAIIVDEDEAAAFALNSVSDGLNVMVEASAGRYIRMLRENGYNPVPVETTELAKAGGGIKCCTQELRR